MKKTKKQPKKKLKRSSRKNSGKYFRLLLKKETRIGGGTENVFRVVKSSILKMGTTATLDTLTTANQKKTTTPRIIAICNADSVITMVGRGFSKDILSFWYEGLDKKELTNLFGQSQNTGRTKNSKRSFKNTQKRFHC